MTATQVVLFGAGPFAELGRYCLTHDSDLDVVGHCVDARFLDRNEVQGLPLVDFATLEMAFPPETHLLMLPFGAQAMNRTRRARYDEARQRGYAIGSYLSSRAVTWPDLSVGPGCWIFEGAIVQPFARIGADSIVRSGAHISHHVEIGDHVFISAGACFGGGSKVSSHCFVGLNATIRDGVMLAEATFVAAGAVVVADTEPGGLYVGVPARRVGPAPD